MLNWSYIESEHKKSLFIIDEEGHTDTISDIHPNFQTIKSLLEEHDRNEELIRRLLDPATTLFSGEHLTRKEGMYYVNGTPVPVELIETLLGLQEVFAADD